MSDYPGALDVLPTDHETGDSIEAADDNALAGAVMAVQEELGLNPAGAAETVAARLDALAAAAATDAELASAVATLNTAVALKQDASSAATDVELAALDAEVDAALAALTAAVGAKQDAATAATDAELAAAVASLTTALGDHTGDATDAHDATAISVTPAGSIESTNVQEALQELSVESGGGVQQVFVQDTEPDVDYPAVWFVTVTGVPTGEVLAQAGGEWAPADDLAIAQAILDAKGDLIVASGDDVPDRLQVGTDGQMLVADSAAPLGLAWEDAGAGGAVVLVAAKATRAIVQAIANTSYVPISFSGVDFDTDDFWAAGAPTRLTIPTGLGGLYGVKAFNAWASNSTGIRVAAITINGTTEAIASDWRGAAGSIGYPCTPTCDRVLVDGDYIELIVRQTSGGSLDATAGTYAPRPSLSLHRLGDAP